MHRLLVCLLTILFAGFGCKPRTPEQARLTDTGTAVPASLDRDEFSARLTACIATFWTNIPDADDESSAKTMFDAFDASGECRGCHTGPSSYGGVGNFTLETEAAFFGGVAVRSHTARTIVRTCFTEGESRTRLLAALGEGTQELWNEMNIRPSKIQTPEGDLYWKVAAGASDEERSQIADRMADALMKGAFEAGASPGDEVYDGIASWVNAGAWLPTSAYVDAITSATVATGVWRDKDGRTGLRWQSAP